MAKYYVNQYSNFGFLSGCKYQAVLDPGSQHDESYIYAASWWKLRRRLRKRGIELPSGPTMNVQKSTGMRRVYESL